MFYKKSIIFFAGLLFISSFFVQAAVVQELVSEKEIENFYRKFQSFNKILSMEEEERQERYPNGYSYKEAWRELFDERHTERFKQIFRNGSRIFSLSTRGTKNTLLHLAVIFENLDLIKLFVEKININARNSEGFTPFLNSILIQNVEIIEFFLDHPDTDLSATDILGNNVFHIAFFGPRSKNRNKQKTRGKVLDLLFREEHFVKISHLLNSPNNDGQTALDLLYREYIYGKEYVGNRHALKQFIDKGAEATLDLDQLVRSSDISEVERRKILELIQELQKYRETDEFTGSEEGRVLDFIQEGEQEDASMSTDIREDEISDLISEEKQESAVVSVNTNQMEDEERDTLMSIKAKEMTSLELFHEIITPTSKTEDLLKKVRLFIDSGYNLEERILHHGQNFLYGLILVGVDIKVVEILMEYKRIGVNDRDMFGRAPIHYLVDNLNYDPSDLYSEMVLSLLLNHPEIDLSVRNQEGKTALELSQQESITAKISKREKELKEMSEEARDRALRSLKTPAYICHNVFN